MAPTFRERLDAFDKAMREVEYAESDVAGAACGYVEKPDEIGMGVLRTYVERLLAKRAARTVAVNALAAKDD